VSGDPTHAVVYNLDAVETFHRFAYDADDARAAIAELNANGLRGWALPWQTYLRNSAVGVGHAA